jgi:hypothetical protein
MLYYGSAMEKFENEVIRIALLAGDEGVIRDTAFERCDIKGPAVLAPMGETVIEHNHFEGDPDALLWEVPAQRTNVIGAVGVENCRFTGCHFLGVGLAGPTDFLKQFRNS